MFGNLRALFASAVPALMLLPALQANSTFNPDVVFKGSTLAGWHMLGQTAWQAQNGELIATPKGDGGWLVLDRSYQDVAVHLYYKCTAACTAGVLLRAEKTPAGMKGVFVSLTNGPQAVFAVTLDPQGKELSRTPLRFASGWVRNMPPADPAAAGRGGARGGAGAGRGGAPGAGRGAGPVLPVTPPDTSFRAGDWNEFEIILDAGIIRSYLNMGRETSGVAEDESGSYGPIALFVGGDSEVRFKEVAYKDLGIRITPTEKVSTRFRAQQISDMYYSWSAAAADFNRDGALDLVAGPYITFGPDFTRSRELFTATAVKPSTEWPYAHCDFTFDFNGDGWPDVLAAPPGGVLYLNPKGESRRWQKFQVVPNFQSEESVMKDVDGDGRPELVVSANSAVGYYKYDPADPTKQWTFHAVSERGYGAAHGIGAGDVNGDGKVDLVNCYGWWEQPVSPTEGTWKYRSQAFGWYSRGSYGGASMFTYDVNGDKLNDVVTAMSAHGFGLGWFEQKRDKDGNISFVQHAIMDSQGYGSKAAGGVIFSQAHGLAVGDVDSDGVPDLIVGKRYWTHLDSYLDADPYGAPVLYWYRTVRNPKAPGGAEFVPELIHNRSGAGSDILAVDLNRDGALDVVSSTNRGAFVFWGKPKPAAKPAASAATTR